MTASDQTISSRVILRCPSCGASEHASAEALEDEPVIVCRNCGDTWPVGFLRSRMTRNDEPSPIRYPVVISNPRLVDAVRRPLVSYSDAGDTIWAAKLHADMAPDPVPESRLAYTILAAICAAFLVAFVAGREAAVASVPDLAGLYAGLGLPVNLQGLAIDGVEAERQTSGTGVVVRGFVVNVSRIARPVPVMKVAMLHSGSVVAGQTEFEPPTRIVEAGGAAAFEFELPDFPADASQVTVRFRMPADRDGGRLALTGRR